MADDKVTAELAAIRDHQENGDLRDFATHDSPRLLAAVEAALNGHRRSAFPASSGEGRGKHYCLDCTVSIDHQTAYALWPCARYWDITTALLGEDTTDG